MEKIKRMVEQWLTKKWVPFFALFPRGLRNFFKFMGEKTYQGFKAANEYRPLLTHQRIDSTEFKLWTHPGHAEAQRTYWGLQETKDVYERLMVTCLTQALDGFADPVFVDIGAFMGYFASYATQYRKDKTAVFAVESNPAYCRTIARTVEENQFKNLKVWEAVLSDRQEVLSVFKETVSHEEKSGSQKIRSVTLDDLCEKFCVLPKILKVDVHGAEGKVLGGAKKILKNSVRCVLLELHPDDYLEKYSLGYSRNDILALLELCGFKNYLIGGFRFKRSPEMKYYEQTGRIKYIQITEANKELLFFDRFVDVFIFSARDFDIRLFPCFAK